MTGGLEQHFPARQTFGAAELSAAARAEADGSPLAFGDDRIIEFFAAVSRRLLRSPAMRQYPEIAALGFFLRRVELCRMLAAVADERPRRRVPRGLVCHFPPGNVPAIFAYSWALSALAGNVNVVRLPTRQSALTELLTGALLETLAGSDPVIGCTQRLVHYGHDDEVTAALSAACDLRVVWGGDDTVSRIRCHRLGPQARDLTFPDRVSFSVFSARGWLAASQADQARAAERFFADTYWYDQAACASPLTVHWVGDVEQASRARSGFVAALAEVVEERGPRLDAAAVVDKRVRTYGLALTGEAVALRFVSNALAIVDMADPGQMLRTWSGPGVFAFSTVPTLSALVPLVDSRHQTVTHFGFASEDISSFAAELGGRGVDRLVPVGDALAFDAVWDGYELLREFSRVMTVR